MELSEAQVRVLRFVHRGLNNSRQVAGYGNAGKLSAANALVRKGLLGSYRTGHYYVTNAGEAYLAERQSEATP